MEYREYGTERIIKLLQPDLLFKLIDAKVRLSALPARKPTVLVTVTRAIEKVRVGITLDDTIVSMVQGKFYKSRAGKLAHRTAKRTYKNVEPLDEAVTEALGLHLHDEDGMIVSNKLIVFPNEIKTHEKREMAAKDLAERQRVVRNQAIPLFRKGVLEWRKARQLREYQIVTDTWGEDDKAIFPHGASADLIEQYKPTRL